MIASGQFALLLAFFLSGYAVFADIAGSWRRDSGLVKSARNATAATLLCLTVAMAALWVLLIRSDFSVVYVAENTSQALPLAYKISALWAGAAGSLLLWLWIQVAFAVAAWCMRDRRNRWFAAHARAIVNFVSMFFLLIMINDRNPFETSAAPLVEGAGLNPLLQHPAMVLHPPILFVGYAAFLVPFAWAYAWLKEPAGAAPMLKTARSWALAAWLFLTVGIVLGAWWAYEELGWGGYWAWDPVENASLLPWLTGTALLHGFRLYKSRSPLAAWTMVLSILTFSLCIFGRFLTKYGLVSSVHAFPDPGLGILYVVLLIHLWVIAAVLIIKKFLIRRESVQTAAPPHKYVIFNNWLLLALTFVILIGTLFPFLTQVAIKVAGLIGVQTTLAPVTLEPSFFTKITAPGGLLLLLLIALCPHLIRRGLNPGWRVGLGIVCFGAAVVTWLATCSLDAPRPQGFAAAMGWRAQWLLSGSPAVPCFILAGLVMVNLAADVAGYVRRTRFSYSGRINRAEYFWTLLWIGLFSNLVFVWSRILPDSFWIYVVLGWIVFPLIASLVVAKRFHDVGKSGWNYFWLFVPVVNVVMGLVLLFRKGSQGANRYGPVPQPMNRSVFRWYGARVVHAGLAIMFVGLAGAGGYGREKAVAMTPGQKETIKNFELTFERLQADHGPNYNSATAVVSVTGNGRPIATLRPALAVYSPKGQTVSEIDVRRTLAGDLYLALTNLDASTRVINLRIMVKPLINWIWIGASLMTLGGLMVIVALRMPGAEAATAAARLGRVHLTDAGAENVSTGREERQFVTTADSTQADDAHEELQGEES